MVERKTRFLLVTQVPNKKSETVRNAILWLFQHFPQAVKLRKPKGTFLKKFPLTSSKTFLFCNGVAKRIKVLREFEGFFAKNLSKH